MFGDTFSGSISVQRYMYQKLPADIHSRVMSVTQISTFLPTHGCVEQAKHICLSKAVWRLHVTRIKKVITLLNGFVHGVSAPQLEQLEIGLAEQHFEHETILQYVGVLSSNVHPGPFLTYVRTTTTLRGDI